MNNFARIVAMRKPIEGQIRLGETDISNLVFDPKSRDDIPQLLRGLQSVYCNPKLRAEVFAILERRLGLSDKGRPGLSLWQVFVLAMLRANCAWDYDRLKNMADHHDDIRAMLGVGAWDLQTRFPLQTLKDNVHLLTEEALVEIGAVAARAGQSLLKKKAAVDGRCDSFVVETDVHYPTDATLLWDAVRKLVTLTARLADDLGLPGWRQWAHQLKKLRKLLRTCQSVRHSTSKDEAKREAQAGRLLAAVDDYVAKAVELVVKAKGALDAVTCPDLATMALVGEIERFVGFADHQAALVQRRCLQGEAIPHAEKLFSLFEPDTEWISKGKAGVPQELGLRVCVLQDQFGHILAHKVMVGRLDVDVAVEMVERAKAACPELRSCSFDKGFWSPENLARLEELLDLVVLPRKGRATGADKERESSLEFIKARRAHSAVESDINALGRHGLDRCYDHGLEGFKRHVAMAVTARNFQKLGDTLQRQEVEWLRRSEAIKAGLAKRAA